MPTSEAPTEVNEPKGTSRFELRKPVAPSQDTRITGSILGIDTINEPLKPANREARAPRSSSRWVDYDTHELLEMIGELEDERRWARLREGFWLALLFHILLFSAITWIPTYIFKVPQVIDPFDAIKQRKDLTYLDLPPDALRESRPKVTPSRCPTSRSSTRRRWRT